MRRLIALICLISLTSAAFPQINIWENSHIKKKVELTPFLAAGAGYGCSDSGDDVSAGGAVIVCPGGSYFWHDMQTEGYAVGEWLQRNGISAFVLRYRTAGKFAFVSHHRLLLRGYRYPDPQEDLLQAIRYIRQHSDELGIDPSRIGVMGFSAGGHLAMSAASYFPADEQPAFIVPVYPVVTMHSPYVHKRSRRALLGDNKTGDEELRRKLSLEDNVPDSCPPVFLVNCLDDPTVKYQNSVLLDSALTAKHIEHEYHLYKTGGHGFGASNHKGTAECREWRDEFLRWFRRLGF